MKRKDHPFPISVMEKWLVLGWLGYISHFILTKIVASQWIKLEGMYAVIPFSFLILQWLDRDQYLILN